MCFLPFKDSANNRSHSQFTKQKGKYTRKPKNDVNVISNFPFMVLLGLWNLTTVTTISLMLL